MSRQPAREESAQATSSGQEPPGQEPSGATQPGGRTWSFSKTHEEIIVAVVLLAVLVFFRLRLDNFVIGRSGRTFLDPDFWPGALLTFGIVLALIYLAALVRTLLRERRPSADADDSAADGITGLVHAPEDAPDEAVAKPFLLAGGFLLLFAYIWAVGPLGFVPSTLLFCVLFMLLVGERRWYALVSLPVALTAGVVLVFTRVLVVPLPRGSGIFLQLSTYLY
ncbi:MAG: hypothetical protein GEU81_15830 [Nitriliruptorales bacterium]|nr:hypothetical protein [Nitriliruptorales bacterium]